VYACRHCSAPYQGAGVRFCGRCGGRLDDPAGQEGDPWLGRVVDRRYRVLDRLGAGGMGVVYRVEHVHLGKIAAMKVLHPAGAQDRDVVRRFHNEAQAVSLLNHPNIVQTFDFGQWDGALFLIMEYVKGEDLAALLVREGPMPFPRAAQLFAQVASALTEAHDAGVIHRDLKPENLMSIRRRDGTEHAKVLDFGLAKLREREESTVASTGGQVVGTPYYMAPEQVRAEPLDARADIYSLGATLYRVLTGTPPFQAPSPMAILSKHITDDVVPPTKRVPELRLPRAADEIILRAMAKSVSDRYASAAEVKVDLERALAGVSANPPAAGSLGGIAADPAVPAADLAATVTIDESDQGDGAHRLRRSDLDDFERALGGRRTLRRLLVPVLALGLAAAAGAFYVRSRAPRGVTTEREPNNTPGYANVIASGVPVRGTIGAPLDGGRPDLDYFRIPAGRGARVVSARVDGVPDVDLVLELFDAQGRRLAKSDAHGVGWGEWLQPYSIGPGEAYLLVRPVWIEGAVPVQNLDDRYLLTATWGPPEPGWELEPNDWEAAATPVTAGRSIRGYLGSEDDKDWFVIMPKVNGRLTGRVSAPAGVDIVLLHGGAATGHGAGAGQTNRQGPGREEEFSLPATADQPILIGVARKPATPAPAGGRAATGASAKERRAAAPPAAPPVTGLDEPYELRSEVAPAP
jgi:serine/threonine-protein kinase